MIKRNYFIAYEVLDNEGELVSIGDMLLSTDTLFKVSACDIRQKAKESIRRQPPNNNFNYQIVLTCMTRVSNVFWWCDIGKWVNNYIAVFPRTGGWSISEGTVRYKNER